MLERPSKLHIDERRVNDVTILDLTGELTLDDGDLLFKEKIESLVDAGQVKILINLSGITKIDSAGLGMLVSKLKKVREKGGDMKLMHLTARSSRALGMMKVLTTFETIEDEDQAVESF